MFDIESILDPLGIRSSIAVPADDVATHAASAVSPLPHHPAKAAVPLVQMLTPKVPLEIREYFTVHAADLIHRFAPDQNSPEFAQNVAAFLANGVMDPWYGTNGVSPDELLSKGDKAFLQSPPMLSYWARKKNFPTISQEQGDALGNGNMVLTYYPPLAESFFNRGNNNTDDYQNKHFYSHCKSSLINPDGSLTVINPELNYNSTIHQGAGVEHVWQPNSNTAGGTGEAVQGWAPDDAVMYNIDYASLGLSEEDVNEGFKFMAADINIMDPEKQRRIFELKDQGRSTDEIIEEMKGEYTYNLQDYNCALKPVAPLVFANEAKIRREGLEGAQAQEARRELGLPNIYNEADYRQINEEFYTGFVQDADNRAIESIPLLERLRDLKRTLVSSAEEAFNYIKNLPQTLSEQLNIFREQHSETPEPSRSPAPVHSSSRSPSAADILRRTRDSR